MLNIVFGRNNCPDKNYVLDTRVYFKRNKEPWWFEDDFVKEFLKAIDDSEVLFEEALKDFRGHGISTEMMSTGCKTLCDIYYDRDDKWFYGSAMGDNCIPFLMRIAKSRDVNIFLEHYMDFPEEYLTSGLVVMNGVVLDQDGYDDAFSDWCASEYEEED